MVLCRRIVAVAALASLAGAAYGHDIPADVTVQALLKPDGQRLRLLVRVPLQAMRDIDYPKPPGATNPDLLDLARADGTLRDAATLWVSDYLDLYEDGGRLPAPAVVSVRAALQSDKSFASYEDARAHLAAPGLPDQTEFFWSQGLLDVHFDYPIRSDRSRFSIQPRLARLGIRTLTVLRFLPPDGGVRGFEFLGDPGLVQLDPLWYQTVLQFVKLGFVRLVDGADHLLFLVVLALPFRRVRPLVAIVTAFVVAHSIALLASASSLAPDALWFPLLVDTLTAASIVYMALENIVITVQKKLRVFSGSSLKRRWLATFGFGLVHGFGLSLALRPALQLAGSHPLTATLSFNVGVELGLLLVLALFVPAFALLFRYLIGWRTGTIVLSALCGHAAWHWMGDRWDLLRKFTFERPAIDAAFLAGALRWLMLLVVAAGLYWLVFDVLDRRRDKGDAENLTSEF
jgi:HupE / UreJ protein